MSDTKYNQAMEWPYPTHYGKENEITADVLIIGGGIAGCHAAINAANKGAKVVVVDKAAVIRSGNGGAGVDHWHGACTNPCCKVSPENFVQTIQQCSSRITVGEHLEQWSQNYAVMHTSPRTAESYQSEVRNHLIPALGAIPLCQLQPQQIENYYTHALSEGRKDTKGGLSARTVLYHHRILSEALSHAVKMRLVSRNVAKAVDPPRPRRAKIATLASDDIPKFLKAASDTPYYALFFTALSTGMRLGEILGLRWCDVDLDSGSLFVVQSLYKSDGVCEMREPKSPHSRRQIAMPSSLIQLLQQHHAKQEVQNILLGRELTGSDLVFAHPDGKPLDRHTVSHSFTKLLEKAGLPHIRFHDLRHTHATLMLKAGVHPKIVSERLGHASVAFTLDTYSHVVPGLQEAAAERFDKLLKQNVCKMFANS